MTAVKHLSYLRAVLDESRKQSSLMTRSNISPTSALCLTSPTAFGLLRKAPPDGSVVNHEVIPPNTAVSVSSYVVHRDPHVFPDPEAFVLERWFGEKSRDLQDCFIIFSEKMH
jgi:Cytochrome P450